MKKLIQKLLMSIAVCFALASADAQFVTIPDANFVNWLNTNGFAGCMNGNQMDTTCSAVVNATIIDVHFTYISNLTGIRYFDNLTEINCAQTPMTNLSVLPPNLISLICGVNQLTTLPALPLTLQVLYCNDNQLTVLPILPSGLKKLSCGGNPLGSLPTLPSTLTELSCYNNQLSSLPALPSSITGLYCSGNQLTSLPVLPAGLLVLSCYNNPFTSLQNLPSLLTILDCYNNQLTSLPILPASLIELSCAYNQLTSLPSLPSSLKKLHCSHNQLTTIPAMPPSLKTVYFAYNQLTSLPALPDTMFGLSINNNPGLTCLPPINRINSFQWSNTGITCLPNSISVGGATPTITGVPICPAPTAPTAISITGGSAKVCPGDTRTYTTPLVSGVTYNWTVPTGSVINNGQGTRTINVSYTNGFTSNGIISVKKIQGCGLSAAKTLNVSRNVAATPSTITGLTYGLCGATNKTYSVTQVAGMTYQWTLPAGASFANGQGTNAVNVNFPSTNFTGTVSVKAVNGCGAGNARNLTVRAVPATPLSITGPTTACANQQNVAYNTAAVATATGYNWLVPTGSIITSGQGTNSIMMNFGTSGGNVKVKASNVCGNGSYKNLAVAINCREGLSVDNNFDVLIYPNPSNDVFTISTLPKFETLAKLPASLIVRDVIGRVAYQNSTIVSDGFEFGSELKAGVYFAEVQLGDERKIVRLIKNNQY